MSKKVYGFVGHHRGVAVSGDGKSYRNEWAKLFELEPEERLLKLTEVYDAGTIGETSHYLLVNVDDFSQVVGRAMRLVEAMVADKEQKEAFKDVLKDQLWDWFNGNLRRYNLDLSTTDPGTIN